MTRHPSSEWITVLLDGAGIPYMAYGPFPTEREADEFGFLHCPRWRATEMIVVIARAGLPSKDSTPSAQGCAAVACPATLGILTCDRDAGHGGRHRREAFAGLVSWSDGCRVTCPTDCARCSAPGRQPAASEPGGAS